MHHHICGKNPAEFVSECSNESCQCSSRVATREEEERARLVQAATAAHGVTGGLRTRDGYLVQPTLPMSTAVS